MRPRPAKVQEQIVIGWTAGFFEGVRKDGKAVPVEFARR
jgi:hypothetical protein